MTLGISQGQVASVHGDRDQAASAGYTCKKGRQIGAWTSHPSRFLTAQRGDRRGNFTPMDTDRAIDEAAASLAQIAATHGPDAIGVFWGTQAYQSTVTYPVVAAWLRAMGTHKFFRTMTIDQSAKSIARGRLGSWHGGPQAYADSDVWMSIGTNPLLSMHGGPMTGFPAHQGRRALARSRSRGQRLIVIDPRRSETAFESDIHLQLRPGTDAQLLAALTHVLFRDRLIDGAFLREHASGFRELGDAVRACAPEDLASTCGVDPSLIVEAARTFGTAKKGMATSGTGANMGPDSNLVEHLIQSLNVLCGRFPREGEPEAVFGMLGRSGTGRAQAISPTRPWETGYRSRFGFGLIDGDLPTASLPREILEPGEDRVRAMVVVGGNPIAALPQQQPLIDAFRSLELLVVLEPFPTATSVLADYVLAPAMGLERPESTRGIDDWFDVPFAQYTSAVLPKPAGVREDWQLVAGLAKGMGLPLRIGGITIGGEGEDPTTDDLLDYLSRHGKVSLDDVRQTPHGLLAPHVTRCPVLPADDSAGRFELFPPDVAAEFETAMRRPRFTVSSRPGPHRMLLCVRRAIDTVNSLGTRFNRPGSEVFNPCRLHPETLRELGGRPGDMLRIWSENGSLLAVAEPDETLRTDVITLTHMYGEFPTQSAAPRDVGSNPNRLLSLGRHAQTINAMPHMTAVPVNISLADQPTADPQDDAGGEATCRT